MKFVFPHKKAHDLLTPETRVRLQALWDEEAKDLLARNGDNPKYPKHYIKDSDKLKAVIQTSFEGFMLVLIERYMAHPKPARLNKEESRKWTAAKEHDEWVINRYAETVRANIDTIVQDRAISGQITGSIIGRALDVYVKAFPSTEIPFVNGDALQRSHKYSKPKTPSRYRTSDSQETGRN